MLKILKTRVHELAREESGVAFVFTVTVSLIVFLFGFAVYACGETVRQRIELQNAADSAAYSAALVQADTISRIAVINKAMAWNYVMMTRRQMDHIVDAWLGKVLEQWQQDRTRTWQIQMGCACHPRAEWANWRVGISPGGGGGEVTHQLIRLNYTQDAWIPTIEAARQEAAVRNPAAGLDSLRNCISAMNLAEEELVRNLKTRIENVVEFAVNANVSLTENDKKDKDKDKCEIRWTLYNLRDAGAYFEKLRYDERRFLGFGGFSGSGQDVYGIGADTWLQADNSAGFRRNYAQSGGTLTATWFSYNQVWWHTLVCVYGGPLVYPCAPVTGEMARDAHFTGQEARPYVLKPSYFGTDGAIVVGVSRPLNNPFAFIFGGGEQSGIYSAFNVGGGEQTMWSVAGARAGYRLPEWNTGEYRNQGRLETKDNLCIADWDAMFLPLRDRTTADSKLLSGVAEKLGATRSFVGKDHTASYSQIEFSDARSLLHH